MSTKTKAAITQRPYVGLERELDPGPPVGAINWGAGPAIDVDHAIADVAENAFRVVALALLRESAHNPRKHFDAKALADLAASVKEKGILVPLLVRPRDVAYGGGQPGATGYEIVAGARRYRAAKAAGLETVPVLVRELDDEQALEVQVIENLQRADVHPLEEAEGYKQLLAKGKYDIAALAAKVGKSVSYIYQRLKLTELVPAAKKAFLEERITAGHAILLARLQPKDQVEALEVGKEYRDEFISVRALASWIHENVHLELKAAPWDLDCATLVPAAGSCRECPKRSGANPQLFPDVKAKDICTDPQCFERKMTEHLLRVQSDLEAAGQRVVRITMVYSHKKKEGVLPTADWRLAETNETCQGLAIGLVVEGGWKRKEYLRGAQVRICTDKKCAAHWDEHDRGGGAGRSGAEKARERKTRALEAGRTEALRQIAAEVKTFDLHAAALRFAERTTFDSQKLACKVLGIWPQDGKTSGFDFRGKLATHIKTELKSPRDVHRIFAVLSLLPEYGRWGDGYYQVKEIPALRQAGKAVGVNVEKLERQFVAEAQAKAKKRAKAKGKAKAKKPAKPQTSAKRGTCRICGCTERKACRIEDGNASCAWADKTETLCTNPACLKAGKAKKAT